MSPGRNDNAVVGTAAVARAFLGGIIGLFTGNPATTAAIGLAVGIALATAARAERKN